MRRFLSAFAAASLLAAAPLRAQNFTITINGRDVTPEASRGPTTATVSTYPATPKPGQPYRLTVRVKNPPRGAGGTATALTGPGGAKLAFAGQNSSYSVVNGAAESSFIFNYTGTAPIKPGSYAIPAQTITLGNVGIKVPETAFVVRELLPGESAYAPATVEVEVDPGPHYVGQEIPARLIVTGSADETPAALSGVSFEDDSVAVSGNAGRRTVTRETVDGKNVVRYVIPLRLTPLTAGDKNLVATVGANFGETGETPVAPRTLVSKPAVIRVEHTPQAGKPESYRGAVGDFMVDTPVVEPVAGKAGEPMTLTFIIAGQGSPDRIAPPALAGKNWSVREEEPVTGVDQNNRPARQYRYTITPLFGGRQKTPTGEVSWFNPKTRRYVVATIAPLEVDVEGPPPPADTGPAPVAHEPAKLAPDPAPDGRLVSWKTPFGNVGFWAPQLLPGMILALAALVTARNRRLRNNPGILVRRRARATLRKERREAFRRLAAGDDAGYARHARAALRAGAGPLSDANAAALTGDETLAALPAIFREKLRPLFDAEEAGRFAGTAIPTTAPTASALREATGILLRSLR